MRELLSKKFFIYTDGACAGGNGGWAAVIIDGNGTCIEKSGRVRDTTNNAMELTAACEGLLAILPAQEATVFTDSEYVRKGITEWLPRWKRNGWKTCSGQSVKNRDLWEALDMLSARAKVQWEWVKGHAGNELNERADALARKEACRR